MALYKKIRPAHKKVAEKARRWRHRTLTHLRSRAPMMKSKAASRPKERTSIMAKEVIGRLRRLIMESADEHVDGKRVSLGGQRNKDRSDKSQLVDLQSDSNWKDYVLVDLLSELPCPQFQLCEWDTNGSPYYTYYIYEGLLRDDLGGVGYEWNSYVDEWSLGLEYSGCDVRRDVRNCACSIVDWGSDDWANSGESSQRRPNQLPSPERMFGIEGE
ncbi:hypothetical protein F4677DRAFT_444441 [Hypoxylon crocopeplum]|nr:hypothetical protein F4677DRAFT_444441 [Hypoxylon crocopeplum]